MAAVKTETITFRILPEIKAALRETAEQEHRRLANMLEVMIRDDSRRCHSPANGQPDAAMLADPTEHPSRSCAS
ncbi:hypothetical protein [uncultured Thiocystis sp.]|jgi:hypothetical protein|uniref:hypothetical protein n=1 Tax=uncultured Thiocystis sp. TaxID=1202134 RepID=UPI0025F73E9B|nr:hypothetical protein [uncultured Thiocystis sp.]